MLGRIEKTSREPGGTDGSRGFEGLYSPGREAKWGEGYQSKCRPSRRSGCGFWGSRGLPREVAMAKLCPRSEEFPKAPVLGFFMQFDQDNAFFPFFLTLHMGLSESGRAVQCLRGPQQQDLEEPKSSCVQRDRLRHPLCQDLAKGNV